MSKVMKQVKLKYFEEGAGGGDISMTTWLEKDARIRKGADITLKDDDRLWTVLEVYDTEVPFDLLEMNRNWDNNDYSKHDGTSMKERLR